MSVANSTRGTDIGSVNNVLFPSSGNFRYASYGSEVEVPSATGEAGNPGLVVWGTNVNVDTCKKEFIEFLKESKFTVEGAEMDEARLDWQQLDQPRPLYLAKLEEILHVPNEPFLTLNCAHLKEFNMNLYFQLKNYPTEVVSVFDMAANLVFQELYPEQEQIIISVRPFNLDRTYTIRGLNPTDINSLITLNGLVTRVSNLIPEMIKAFFRCTVCYSSREVLLENTKVAEPHICTVCHSKFSFELVHNRSRFVDKQIIKLQESPEEMPAGQTPSTIALVACADLVDKVSPGDRVEVTGVYRVNPVRVLPTQRKFKCPYRVTIDVIHYRKIQSGRLHGESSDLRFNPDRVDKLRALAKNDLIYEKLATSLAPSIFGHIDVKKGVLLQLFGGTRKETQTDYSDPKLRHFRAEINVLLCGDPGTSKSQMLQYIHKIVPRGQYTSGKGSSAVGLTAYVTKDVDTKQLVLQTGALVMCDGGICCIDEFDKMSDSTRGILHEVMEQQTLSIAKAGIVCQLNARTSILAAANPVQSQWDRNKSVIENVKLPDTLLSRFDLIYLILDPNDVEYDKRLAKHLIAIFFEYRQTEEENELIPHDFLKDYIAYARTNINPRLTEDICKVLVENYVELREKGKERGHIKVYPRNLESLIRLSEAHAKLRLSNVVEMEDVVEAVRLTREALKHSSTDPETGVIGTAAVETEV